jgi:hypothetical protein
MKSTPPNDTPQRSARKLRLHRETLLTLHERDLRKAAGGDHTKGGHCFSEPSLCPTCLCT